MNDKATLHIQKLGHQGDGLAPWKEANGRFIRASVPFTLPDETVEASLREIDGHAHGTLINIITAHPERQTPPCPHFGACGGCRLQHAPKDMVEELKKDQIARALHYNGITFTPTAIFTTPIHSRRRATLHGAWDKGVFTLGFQKRESHELVPVGTCPVLKAELEKLLGPLKEFLKDKGKDETLQVMLTTLLGKTELCITGLSLTTQGKAEAAQFAVKFEVARMYARADEKDEYEVILVAQPLEAQYGNYSVALPPAPFLQASDEAEAAMLAFLAPHMRGIKHYADLFCGTGLFALSFYKNGCTVLAADADKNALGALAAAKPAAQGIKIIQRNLLREPISARELSSCAVVLLDPPRAGAREQCLEIAKSKAAKVLYISCNPQSFARDARILHDGGYRLQDAQAFDQFLFSQHTEVIGVFVRE